MLTIPLQDREAAILRYTEIAHRLPQSDYPSTTHYVEHLEALCEHIDVFVLDGFGVLNLGAQAIPGAVQRVARLQQLGKLVLVLTNGATQPVEKTWQKYLNWGFSFELEHVISSRNALEQALQQRSDDMLWGVAGAANACIDQLAAQTCLLGDNPETYAEVDGFILLSTQNWSDHRQQLLSQALGSQRRPVWVGNPDLVAPREDSMSIEPGFFAHALADADLCEPQFFGKPFQAAFELVKQRIPSHIEPQRIAMVGDTFHTDILGGATAGWRSVLIKNYGLMRDADVEATVRLTGIRPDFVAAIT